MDSATRGCLRTAHIAALTRRPMITLIGIGSSLFADAYYRSRRYLFARTGLKEHEARMLLGDAQIFSTTVFGSAAESWVYEQEMCVKLIVDKSNNRVVGGEVFGRQGVERRIDLLSVAVLEGWSPDQIIDLDMAYLANSGPAFDPLKTRQRVQSLLLQILGKYDGRAAGFGGLPIIAILD